MSQSRVQRKKELNIKLEINTQFDLKNVMHYKSASALLRYFNRTNSKRDWNLLKAWDTSCSFQ